MAGSRGRGHAVGLSLSLLAATVHDSSCSDRIVATSPLVKEVIGGEGK
jgi:hypothetical protein